MKITPRFGPHQIWLLGEECSKRGWLKVSPDFVRDPIFRDCMHLMGLSILETRREFRQYADFLLITGEKLVPVPKGHPPPTYFIEIRTIGPRFDTVGGRDGRFYPRITGAERMFSLKLERNGQSIWNVMQPILNYEQDADYNESPF